MEKAIDDRTASVAKKWAKEVIKRWHDKLRPEYVFLTETAGTQYGWILKETWIEAYGRKNMPKFYRIDPRSELVPDGKGPQVRDYFEKRIIRPIKRTIWEKMIGKRKPTIIVYDELTLGHKKGYFSSKKRTEKKSIDRAANFILNNVPEANIYIEKGSDVTLHTFPETRSTSKMRTLRKPLKESALSPDEHYQFEVHKYPQQPLTGNIVKLSSQRRKALDYIDEVKRIGKEAGEELKRECEKPSQLEKKVIAESILSIGITLLVYAFFSSKITGRATVIESANKNPASLIFFLLGITAVYIYFKIKK